MKRILLLRALQCAAVAAASSSDDVCPVDNSDPVVPLDFFTTTDALGPFYVENTPLTSVLALPSLLENPADVFVIHGKVLGNDCMPLVNAQVEAWYAGEAGYSDTENRGQLRYVFCGKSKNAFKEGPMNE